MQYANGCGDAEWVLDQLRDFALGAIAMHDLLRRAEAPDARMPCREDTNATQ